VRPWELLRESLATAMASRVTSILMSLVVAGMCFASIATVGRTASAAADVAGRLEEAGARTLRVVDTASVGIINPASVGLIENISEVTSAHALSVPFDTVNGAIGAGGERVPTWAVTGDLESSATLAQGRLPQPGEALLSVETLRRLRLEHPIGFLTTTDGTEQFPVVGAYRARGGLSGLNAGAVVNEPQPAAGNELVVIINDTSAVAATVQAVLSILAPPPSADLRVESPTSLARTARQLEHDLAKQGRSLLLLILGIGGTLIAVVVLGQVMIRRRDLGRRRTLGASRGNLMILVAGHCALASVLGAITGTTAALLFNTAAGQQTPLQFGIGIATLGVLTATLAALPPAAFASRMDPVTVMRVP